VVCGRTLRKTKYGRPGFSRKTGKLYRDYDEMSKQESLPGTSDLRKPELIQCKEKYWLDICKECYDNRAKMPYECTIVTPIKVITRGVLNRKAKLVKCPDCEQNISRRAASCPHCGCPVFKVASPEDAVHEAEPQLPSFPEDMFIGREIFGLNAAATTAIVRSDDNLVKEIADGKVIIRIHKFGISIHAIGSRYTYDIHDSQIISATSSNKTSSIQYVEEQKSVIGRAIVGGLIAGSVGAIVGGLSGQGTKKSGKTVESSDLTIDFWEIKNGEAFPQCISLCAQGCKKFDKLASDINERATKWRK